MTTFSSLSLLLAKGNYIFEPLVTENPDNLNPYNSNCTSSLEQRENAISSTGLFTPDNSKLPWLEKFGDFFGGSRVLDPTLFSHFQ